VGGLLVAASVMLLSKESRLPGLASLLPCGGVAMIIRANSWQPTTLRRVLSLRPVVFIGLISYSLYLWHWPIFVFARYLSFGPLPVQTRILLILASFALSILSWRYVETPFRQRLVFKSPRNLCGLAVATSAVVLVFSAVIHKLNGVPSRLPEVALQFAQSRADRAFIQEIGLDDARHGRLVELGEGTLSLPARLFVWGDSHAMAALPVIDRLCRENAVRGLAATHSSTAPLLEYTSQKRWSLQDECIPYNEAVFQCIRANQVSDVILIAAWSSAYPDDERLGHALSATVLRLRGIGARVWIMKQVPLYRSDVPRILANATLRGRDIGSLGLSVSEHLQASRQQDVIFQALEGVGVRVLDPLSIFDDGHGRCRIMAEGKSLYCDSHHLTIFGAMQLRPLFSPIFCEMAGLGSANSR
jgi:hypothetical protein